MGGPSSAGSLPLRSPLLPAAAAVTFPKPQGTKGRSPSSSEGTEKSPRNQSATFTLSPPRPEASFHAEVSVDGGREGEVRPCRPVWVVLCCRFPPEARAALEGLSGNAACPARPQAYRRPRKAAQVLWMFGDKADKACASLSAVRRSTHLQAISISSPLG